MEAWHFRKHYNQFDPRIGIQGNVIKKYNFNTYNKIYSNVPKSKKETFAIVLHKLQ